jgi:hypothetical protein
MGVRPGEAGPHSGGGQITLQQRFVLEAKINRDRVMPFNVFI